MFSIINGVVTLTKGEKALFEVALETEKKEEYKVRKTDFFILIVYDDNGKELFSAESQPGNNLIVILPKMTDSLLLGKYKYSMWLESSGQRKKLILNSSDFILC